MSGAKLKFLGHAGYVVERGPLYLAIDPWLDGSAFDNGWDMLVPAAKFDPKAVTHLWFSHEHPDHFSVPAMKSIPKERRSEITVVFQETKDKRVVNFMRGNGFGKVIEVQSGQRVDLADRASITTSLAKDGDSCHLLEIDGFRILNFNDCFYYSVSEVEEAMKSLGIAPGEVDIMATQFSYANWMGNPGEPTRRQQAARRKLEHLEMQAKTVRPKYVMPFASFVYFSHEENAYLNDSVNAPSRVIGHIRDIGFEPVVFRPGDEMELTLPALKAASSLADDRARELDEHLKKVQSGEREMRKSAAVPLEDVLATVRAGLERLKQGVSKLDYTLMRIRLRRAIFELSDHKCLVVIDTLSNVRVEPLTSDLEGDVVLSSEALKFAFSQDFGFDTLLVNGRFREVHPGRAATVMTLCGQFSYVRRKESLAKSIVRRRLYDAPRLALERLRNRALAQ
jgi:UDP-MurNAc hydroxylase